MDKIIIILFITIICCSCSTINVYGMEDIQWGGYGNAWTCDHSKINKKVPTSYGLYDDLTDFVTKPIMICLNIATFRFLWGNNEPWNLILEMGSLLPFYSHYDEAFWYDYGIKSLDDDDKDKEKMGKEE